MAGQEEQYFVDHYQEFAVDLEMLSCGEHNRTHECGMCGLCYACAHKLVEFGNGQFWWKCRNGSKHRAFPDRGMQGKHEKSGYIHATAVDVLDFGSVLPQ